MRQPWSHSPLVGVTLSLLLHGLALLLLLPLGTHHPSAPVPAEPLMVQLLGGQEPRPVVGPVPEVPHRGPAAHQPAAPRRGSASQPPPTLPPASTGAESPRAWFEANGLGATPPPGGTDLSVRLPSTQPGSGQASPGGSGDAPPGPGTQARVQAIMVEALGHDRVRNSFDPYWAPIIDRLRASFQPDWSLLEEGPRPPGLAATGFARMLSGYLRMAERFARSERLSDKDGVMGERTSEAGKVADRMAAAGSQASFPMMPPVERFENPFQQEYVTLVEVVQRDDGSVEGIRLRQTCGHGAVDRLAVLATRRALEAGDRGPVPGAARTSVWSFTATFGVLPPAPAIGCPLDVLWKGEPGRCAYPLKQTAEGRVELYALE
jgi:hypothetical protein